MGSLQLLYQVQTYVDISPQVSCTMWKTIIEELLYCSSLYAALSFNLALKLSFLLFYFRENLNNMINISFPLYLLSCEILQFSSAFF